MGGIRCILRLSIVAISVLMFAAVGWGGGPPAGPSAAPSGAEQPGEAAADRGEVGQSYSGSQPSTGGGAEQGGLNMTGGRGGGGMDGANGRSPGFTLQDIGIANGFTNQGRMKYDPIPIADMSFTFTFDYSNSVAVGSTRWPYNASPFIQGDSLSSSYTVATSALSLDIDTSKMIGGGSWIVGGPRVQFTNFSDNLIVDDTTNPGFSRSGAKGYSMFGFGFWGSLDLAHMTGLGWSNDTGIIKPRLNAAVTMGKGGGMNYWEWEAFLQLFKTASSLYTSGSFGVGQLAVEVGYAKYYFNETIQQVTAAGVLEDGNVRMSVSIPVIRASLPISF